MRLTRITLLTTVLAATVASAQFVTKVSGPVPVHLAPNMTHASFLGAFDFGGRTEQQLSALVSLPYEIELHAAASSWGGTVNPDRVSLAGSWGYSKALSDNWRGGGALLGGVDFLRQQEPLRFSWATDQSVGPRAGIFGWALHQPSGIEFHASAIQTLYTRSFEATGQIAMADGRAIISAGVGSIGDQLLITGGASVRMKLPGTPTISAYAAQDLTDNRTLGMFALALTFEGPGGNAGTKLEPLPNTGDVAEVQGRVPEDARIESLGVPGKATVVMFCADWVHACRTVWEHLLPIPKADPRIAVRRVNVDQHPAFAVAQNVGKIPTVIVIDPKGRVVGSSDVYDEKVLALLSNALWEQQEEKNAPVEEEPMQASPDRGL